MRVVSIKEMRDIESKVVNEYKFDESLIIENVGIQGAHNLKELLIENDFSYEVVFLIGKGNNGADGMAIARHLQNMGFRTRAFIFFSDEECKPELKKQIDIAQNFGVPVNFIESASQLSSYFDQMGSEVVVDALFGTGVQLPLSNFLYEVIEVVNEQAYFTVSIDMPSGVNGDSGLMSGKAIKAECTFAIGFAKQGYYVADGARHTGEVKIINIGLPEEFNLKGNKFLLKPEQMVELVGKRDKFADKKVFGHSLVLGGSHGLTGAAALTSLASLKVGSGLVTAATWEPQYQELIPRLVPEIMTGYLPLDVNKWDPLIKDLNKYSSIVVGPGLARSSRARRLVLEVLNNYDGPVVLDADAINVLNIKEDKDVFTLRNAPTVLTPHFGEFSKFSGISREELALNPLTHLKSLINRINCTVVLKGPCTYLGCSDGSTYFNYYPNDGMATGGVGDVLAGILGGLLGQEVSLRSKDKLIHRYDTFNRTVAVAIYLHSVAGKYAAQELGVRTMSAKSIIDFLPKAFDVLDDDMDRIKKGQ
ncbi:MAG: hypothetical protein CME62_03800 [Halobacteriovoraceae bacterium]|nr:hypothetical protein [Halobacteriovoraceae bacterium]|tara:strand:+ start:12213 stop:13814 length:1602 start_codon:yes stop_codon:yes gene_type:complete